ncbi:hypothetical protein ALC53_10722 [Atta colombica]|uniref:Uncharacterized protein n=1 Tax=Atta colombica TaxID=520822 RepID=A0A151I0C0_9HYME|nr:hypothetical protein ALC53_10722 [Atta colombica]
MPDCTWTRGTKTSVRRGRMVAAALGRDVEIQYRKSEHTYRLGKLGSVYNTAQEFTAAEYMGSPGYNVAGLSWISRYGIIESIHRTRSDDRVDESPDTACHT